MSSHRIRDRQRAAREREFNRDTTPWLSLQSSL
jgi:hypothetical protein